MSAIKHYFVRQAGQQRQAQQGGDLHTLSSLMLTFFSFSSLSFISPPSNAQTIPALYNNNLVLHINSSPLCELGGVYTF